jgi:hypothetical protein
VGGCFTLLPAISLGGVKTPRNFLGAFETFRGGDERFDDAGVRTI